MLRAWSTSALSLASTEYRTQPMNVETATQCARDCPRLEEGAPQPQLLPPQPSGKRQGKRSLNSPRSICSQARIIICSVHARAPSTPALSTFHTEVRRSPCLCAAGQATSPYGRSLRSHPPGLHLPSALGLTSQLGRVSTIPPQDGSEHTEPTGTSKPQMTHIPILSLDVPVRRSCSTMGEGARRGAAVPSPLPAGATMA